MRRKEPVRGVLVHLQRAIFGLLSVTVTIPAAGMNPDGTPINGTFMFYMNPEGTGAGNWSVGIQ